VRDEIEMRDWERFREIEGEIGRIWERETEKGRRRLSKRERGVWESEFERESDAVSEGCEPEKKKNPGTVQPNWTRFTRIPTGLAEAKQRGSAEGDPAVQGSSDGATWPILQYRISASSPTVPVWISGENSDDFLWFLSSILLGNFQANYWIILSVLDFIFGLI
jgi:hypothetical protein